MRRAIVAVLAVLGVLGVSGCTPEVHAACSRPGVVLPDACLAAIRTDPRAWGWEDGLGAIRVAGVAYHVVTCPHGGILLVRWEDRHVCLQA